MQRVLLRPKSSMKTNMKSVPIVKTATKESGIEFRWSILAAQFALLEKNSSSNIRVINLDNSPRKSFFSSSSSTSESKKFI
jgi:hypothetical protein